MNAFVLNSLYRTWDLADISTLLLILRALKDQSSFLCV